MRVVVAEKPSVARDLATMLGATKRHDGWIEGDGVAVTWCVGHLVELDDPASYSPDWKPWRLDRLPMVPATFRLRARKEGGDQLEVLRKLLRSRSTRELVNACDAGREGELIFRYVYDLLGCTQPVLRLWVSSLTDEALREGWRRLAPSARFDPLADAARSRSEADWLVGLNVTRAMTCRTRDAGGDALWSVGRVQTPTLAMIVRRDQEIASFVPETFWQVKATFEVDRPAGPVRWVATWFGDTGGEKERPAEGEEETPKAERLASAALAEAVVAATVGRPGRVVTASRQEKRERPPLLYDLTSLQRRASQRYGMSAQHTLDVAQVLYERHKLITYPRTDARYLTSDQAGVLPAALRALTAVPVYQPFAAALLAAPLRLGPRVINDAEVGDHHAILPTATAPEAGRLSADERRIYDLVARRLMAALSPDAIFDNAEIIVEVPATGLPEPLSAPLRYRAKGRVQREAGWRAVDPPGANRDLQLPLVTVGEDTSAVEAEAHEGQTRPPRPHDDASLLLAMETAGKGLDDRELARAMRSSGLGTPATRAAILQTLVERAYVVREGRTLRSTERGRALIEVLPVEELKSAELTGRWEARLTAIAEGREGRAGFMADVGAHVHEVVDAIRGAQLAAVMSESKPTAALGACPMCPGTVRERGNAWRCDAGCGFVIWGSMAKRKISPTLAKELLRDKKTKAVKGFKSKAGAEFEAGLELQPDGKVTFWFPPREEGAPRGEPSGRGAGAAGPREEASRRPPGARSEAAPPRASSARPKAARPEKPAPRSAKPAAGRGAVRATSAMPEVPPAMPPQPDGAPCPHCGEGRVIRGRAAWGCDRWQQGCGWRLSFVGDDGAPRSSEQVRAALAAGRR